jgi:hypothetical protein
MSMGYQLARAMMAGPMLAGSTGAPPPQAAAQPSPAPAAHTQSYSYPQERGWRQVMSVLGRRQLYISTSDQRLGLIQAQLSIVAPPRSGTVRDWADCGAVGLTERPVSQLADLTIGIQPFAAGATISVTAQFTEVREGVDGAVRTLRCTSTGVLEDDMLLRFSQPSPVQVAGGGL